MLSIGKSNKDYHNEFVPRAMFSFYKIGNSASFLVKPPADWEFLFIWFPKSVSKSKARKDSRILRRAAAADNLSNQNVVSRSQMVYFHDEEGVEFACKECAGNINRNLSEVCCTNKSFMGLKTADSFGCNVTQITIKEDFTTDFGLQMTISNIKGPHDGAWVCIPCTGGCSYNGPNYKNYEGARRKMLGHLIFFRKMKRSLLKLLEHCWSVGAFLLIEWPKSCACWNDPDIVVWIVR